MRRRARDLVLLARRVEHAAVMTLPQLADERTWVGPTPQRCYDDLRWARSQLLRSCDDLRRTARRLERRADEIDAQALLAPARI